MRSDYKELLFWFKTNPDLEHIRRLAGKTKVSFNKNSEDPTQRIKVFNIPEYKTKKGFLKNLWETIWVPGHKLRGNSYTDRNYEEFLNQTSSIMSLSTIGDLVCTGPILYYFTKAAGILSFPFSLGIGYLLLLMSNKAGEFSMNRPKDNTRASSYLLLIFFGLSLVKTLMSGVGIDLVSRSQEIKNKTAENYLFEAPLVIQKNKNEYGELLSSVSKECEKLESQQNKLNLSNRRDRRLFSDLQEEMFKKPDQLINSDPNYLLENYLTSLGPCTKKDLITSLNGRNKFKRNESLISQNKLRQTQSPTSYLYIFQRNKFYNLFNGNPLIGDGENLRKYEKSFKESPIDFNIDCSMGRKDCESKIEWANPGMAINQASTQFYNRLFNKEWENLGFSFVGFLISVLLSTSATVLLYTASTSVKNRASRSSHLAAKRNEYFSDIQDNMN